MPTSAAAYIKTSSPLVIRSLLTDAAAVDQMADDFRRLVVTKGGVDAEDLLVAGWDQEQVNQYGHQARRLAIAASVRELEHVKPRRRRRAA
jgi:hypothetical protein